MNKHYLPALLWLTFVTVLSVTPGVPLPKFDLLSPDKLGHAVAYGVLAWLFLWGYTRTSGRRVGWKEALVVFLLTSCYGVLMELVQGFLIPGRFYEIDDMLANAIGAAIAWLANRIPSAALGRAGNRKSNQS